MTGTGVTDTGGMVTATGTAMGTGTDTGTGTGGGLAPAARGPRTTARTTTTWTRRA